VLCITHLFKRQWVIHKRNQYHTVGEWIGIHLIINVVHTCSKIWGKGGWVGILSGVYLKRGYHTILSHYNNTTRSKNSDTHPYITHNALQKFCKIGPTMVPKNPLRSRPTEFGQIVMEMVLKWYFGSHHWTESTSSLFAFH